MVLYFSFLFILGLMACQQPSLPSPPKVDWQAAPYFSNRPDSAGLAILAAHRAKNPCDSLGPYFYIQEGDVWGLCNSQGELVLPPVFLDLGSFDQEGLAPARLRGHYGYINSCGEFILPPIYDYALPFVDGLALVQYLGRGRLINRQGQSQYDTSLDIRRHFFSEDYVRVYSRTGRQGLLHRQGHLILDTIFEDILKMDFTLFGERYYWPSFQSAPSSHLIVYKDSLWGLIDSSGNWILELSRTYIGFQYPGFLLMQKHSQGSYDYWNNPIGLCDLQGRVVFPIGRYEKIRPIDWQRFIIRQRGDSVDYLVNRQGQILRPAKESDFSSMDYNPSLNNALSLRRRAGLYEVWHTQYGRLGTYRQEVTILERLNLYRVENRYYNDKGRLIYAPQVIEPWLGQAKPEYKSAMHQNSLPPFRAQANFNRPQLLTWPFWPIRPDSNGTYQHRGLGFNRHLLDSQARLQFWFLPEQSDTIQFDGRESGYGSAWNSLGMPVLLYNPSNKPYQILDMDSRNLQIILQAKMPDGTWCALQGFPSLIFCGNSLRTTELPPGGLFEIRVPYFEGTYQTELRLCVLVSKFRETWEEGLKNGNSRWLQSHDKRYRDSIYSPVFKGQINLGQTWCRQALANPLYYAYSEKDIVNYDLKMDASLHYD